MIDYPTYCAIRQARDREGLSGRQIAEQLGLHPETVSKWLNRPAYEQRHRDHQDGGKNRDDLK